MTSFDAFWKVIFAFKLPVLHV